MDVASKLQSLEAKARASDRNFTRGHEERYRAPLVPEPLSKRWLHSNQNTGKTATTSRFTNIAPGVAV